MGQTQERYQVIINNQLAKGYTLEKVIDNLSLLFKKDKKAIRQILSQPGFVVKSDISIEQAKKIQLKLMHAGIGCHVNKIEPADSSVASLPEGAHVSCPKCGLHQLASSECQSCGIIFAKYGAKASVYDPQKQLKKTALISHSERVWYTKGVNVFALLIVVVAVILLLSTHETKKEIDPSKVGIVYYEIEDVRFIDDLAEPGYVTIVELYADWCKTCTSYLNYEKNYIMKINPRMAIRRIDISRWNGGNIAEKRFNLDIQNIPYIIVFNEDGKIIADDSDRKNGGSDYVWYYGR